MSLQEPTAQASADLASLPAAAYCKVIRAFGEIAEAMSDEDLPLETFLHLVARKTCELVGATRCSLYLYDERTELYHGQVGHATRDIDDDVKRLTAGTIADGFTREILETLAPVVLNDAQRDPRLIRATARTWQIKSMMGVPMVVRGEVIGLIFVDNEDEVRAFEQGDREIAMAFADLAAAATMHFKVNVHQRETLRTVARQNGVLRRLGAVDDRLSELVLVEGAGHEQIAAAVSELTGKPCAIHDAAGHLLIASSPRGMEDADASRLLKRPGGPLPNVDKALNAQAANMPAVVGPFREYGLHQRYLVAPVAGLGERWGTIVLLEHGSRLNRLDLYVTRRAATIVALQMTTERRSAVSDLDARMVLAQQIVDHHDHDALTRRARYLNVPLDCVRWVCALPADDQSDLLSRRDVVVGAFERAAPGRDVLLARVDDAMGVMVEAADATSARSEASNIAAAACRDVDPALIAAISDPCEPGLRELARATRESLQVLRAVRRLKVQVPSHRTISAHDLGSARVFLSSANLEETEGFVAHTLGPLLEPQYEDLLRTLAAFLDVGRNARRTSERLGLHENTIRHRLSRLEELLGPSVMTDADVQMGYQLAIQLLRLWGRLESTATSAPVTG